MANLLFLVLGLLIGLAIFFLGWTVHAHIAASRQARDPWRLMAAKVAFMCVKKYEPGFSDEEAEQAAKQFIVRCLVEERRKARHR